MQKTRRPGDQAPPPRPVHRNDGRTATTHVKDASGMFYVHDGSPEQAALSIDGRKLEMLSYDEARKAKDLAVAKLKARKAGIASQPTDDTGYCAAPTSTDDAVAAGVADAFHTAEQPLVDPVLEAARQKAVAAAKVKAQEAQQRAALARQRAPGWEAPPPGVSSANKASPPSATQQRAPGWVDPTKSKTPPKAPELVGMDPLPDPGAGDDAANDPEVSDLLINPDLEADVKAETEQAHAEAQKLWDALPADKQAELKTQVLQCATEEGREALYKTFSFEQCKAFEASEIAYHLLFGLPGAKQS